MREFRVGLVIVFSSPPTADTHGQASLNSSMLEFVMGDAGILPFFFLELKKLELK